VIANKNNTPKLAIVIHTEEEFDWNSGFFRSNNDVTHGKELIEFCEQMIIASAKITFAMDYAFVNSEQGQRVINHFKSRQEADVEFATHLHPWVTPPFIDENDKVDELNSYPGNLPYQVEFDKLNTLTKKIEELTYTKPFTYLAGRYGVGENSYNILKELGYKIDLSISPFANFSHQQGPNFSNYTNQAIYKNDIKCIPHTKIF